MTTVLEELTDALNRADIELDVMTWLAAMRRAQLVRDWRSEQHAEERMNRSLEQLARMP